MIDLANKSFAHVVTHGGRIVFIVSDKGDDIIEHIAAAAISLEQIGPDPGKHADLSKHGIAELSEGTFAIEEIQKTVNCLTSQQ